MAKTVEQQIRENLDKLIRQPNGDSVQRDADGSLKATVIYLCRWDRVLQLMPRRFTGRHPDFNGMIVDTVQATREVPGIARLTVTYTGGAGSDGGPDGEGEFLPIEELSTATSQEPIETHADWSTAIGGTKDDPKNDSAWNDDGTFKKFKSGSRHEGVTAYLAPGGTYTRTYMSTSKPTSISVGSIASPIGAPAVSGSYNWLSAGQTWSKQGGTYNVSESYMLSAAKGWNTTIYS